MKLKHVLKTLAVGSLASILALAAAQAATAKAGTLFEVTKHFGLEGAERWDYVAYDPVRHHL